MAVISFRPHRVRFAEVSTQTQNNGLVGESLTTWSEYVPCSTEPSRGTREIAFADGTTKVYNYAVRLDVKVAKQVAEYLQLDTQIELELLDGRREVYNIIGYQLYQTYAILWV